MIGVFADPYPDELFYSICARICQRAGYSSHSSAMRDLFGQETAVPSVAFPSHLNALVSRLPPRSAVSSDSLIAQHTLLPFYQPFLVPERSRRLQQEMCGEPSLQILNGIPTSSLPQPQWLRFCPQCVEEDRTRYGECYWHRIHQIFAVEICPLHEGYLQESDVSTEKRKLRHGYVSAEQAIRWAQQQPPQTQSPYHQILLALARDVDFLLRKPDLSQEPALLSLCYRKLLYERDLATYRGRVDGDLFLRRFKNCYPPQFLQLLHCEIEERVQPWPLRLVRPPRNAQHPLHHLLLIHFLGYTAQDFFGLSVEDNPFGDGPWPCLNPVCPKSRQLCIRECQIVHSRHVSGKPIGTFVCTCGFAYSRTGPDTAPPFRVRRIQTFGPLWEERLRMLWEDKNASLQAIATQLGVEPPTVKRHALRIGLSLSRPGDPCLQLKRPTISGRQREPGDDPVTLETKRATWLALMQAHPEVGVTLLRSKEPALFRWLYRHDKMWLSAHKPLTQPYVRVRVDWQARDLQLAEQVRDATLLLKNLPGRPVRLTLSSISREIGQSVLHKPCLEKLPRTTEVLRAGVETHETFAVRRVWWATTAFRQEHIYPQRWQLIRRAGVARLVGLPEVKRALDTALQSLGREGQV